MIFIKDLPNIKFHGIPSSQSRANTLGETDGRFQRLMWMRLKTNIRRKVTAVESNERQKHGKTTNKIKIIHFPLRITKNKREDTFNVCVNRFQNKSAIFQLAFCRLGHDDIAICRSIHLTQQNCQPAVHQLPSWLCNVMYCHQSKSLMSGQTKRT